MNRPENEVFCECMTVVFRRLTLSCVRFHAPFWIENVCVFCNECKDKNHVTECWKKLPQATKTNLPRYHNIKQISPEKDNATVRLWYFVAQRGWSIHEWLTNRDLITLIWGSCNLLSNLSPSIAFFSVKIVSYGFHLNPTIPAFGCCEDAEWEKGIRS